jgi:L-serine kinase (ATP) / ParB family transcriptional regulator, heme-responsive regulator
MSARHQQVPTLRLVPTASVRFHEHPERHRTVRLVERLRQDLKLRNPPIVTALGDGAYVLLDGANRVSAFRALGYAQIPVQVVDYADPSLELKQWHHLLLEGAGLELRAAYRNIRGVRLESVAVEQIASFLERRMVFAVLVDERGTAWGLFPDAGAGFGLRRWMGVLEQVVGAYEGRTQLERIKWAEYSDLPPVYQGREHQLCLYPTIGKPELLQIVRDGLLIPTGITRHIVPGRALSLNLDLEFLTDLQTDAEREAHFDTFVHRLEVHGRIRFYEESVFLLNE